MKARMAIITVLALLIAVPMVESATTTIRGILPGEDAALLGSGDATDGKVLSADGSGGAAWEDAASPTCWALADGIWVCDGDAAVAGDLYEQGALIIYGTTGALSFVVPEEEGPRYSCGYDVADDRVECTGIVDYSGATVTGLPAAAAGSDDVSDDSNWALTTVSGALDAIKAESPAWDATICASGCTYSDLSTAANSTTTGDRVYVKAESFTLTSVFDIDEVGQTWVFDGATIDVATYGAGVSSASGTTTLRGSIALTGTGGADMVGSGYATIFTAKLGGGVLDASGLTIDVTESRSSVSETAFWGVYLEGGMQRYGLMRVHDIVVSHNSTVVAGIVAGNGVFSGDFIVTTVNNTGGTSPYAQGLQLNGPHSFAGRVIVNAVTTDTGNGGTGVVVQAGANYNSLTGMVWGSDSGTNLNDGGTGTSKTGLTSTT
jgi:hypothetical protein